VKKILVDQENNEERFWDEINDRAEKGDQLAQRLAEMDLTDPLYLEDDEAEELWAYAQQVPGWADGPEHAREALLVQDLPGCEAVAVELRPEAEWAEGGLGTYQPHRDGREVLVLQPCGRFGGTTKHDLDNDDRVIRYWDVTIYDEEVPGSRPLDSCCGEVGYVLE